MARWSGIETSFRASLRRYGVSDPETADDLTQEVLGRLTAAQIVPATDRGLLRLAEYTAQHLILDLRRKDQRRVRLEYPGDLPGDESEAEDPQEVLGRVWEVQERLDGLSPHDREAVALMIRGGPFNGTERSKMARARPRLFETFWDLLGGMCVRWHRLRLRIGNPPPLIPFVAGAMLGIVVGNFCEVSAARSDPASMHSVGMRAPATAGQASASPPGSSAAPVPTTALPAAAQASTPEFRHLGPVSDRPAAATVSTWIARSPTENSVAIAVDRWIPPLAGRTVAPVAIHCGTAVGQVACAADRALPR